ncbi:MAG: hypothetical protein KC492_36425 [Myxococcales bacterium]|nr:hypothetical protein [Myxococcales bacterium]
MAPALIFRQGLCEGRSAVKTPQLFARHPLVHNRPVLQESTVTQALEYDVRDGAIPQRDRSTGIAGFVTAQNDECAIRQISRVALMR